jgi:WD40 repeat protein
MSDYQIRTNQTRSPGPSQHIALGGMDNLISIYAPTSLNKTPDLSSACAPAALLEGHSGYISSLSFFAVDKLFSTSGDGCAMVWDANMPSPSHVLKGSTGHGLTCGAPHPDSPAMFVTCEVRELPAMCCTSCMPVHICLARSKVTYTFGMRGPRRRPS